MIERRPGLTVLSHAVLILGVLVVGFPLYLTFVASTQTAEAIVHAPMSLLPGNQLIENYTAALQGTGMGAASNAPVGRMMMVSLITALVIAIGKIAISLLSAFAIEGVVERVLCAVERQRQQAEFFAQLDVASDDAGAIDGLGLFEKMEGCAVLRIFELLDGRAEQIHVWEPRMDGVVDAANMPFSVGLVCSWKGMDRSFQYERHRSMTSLSSGLLASSRTMSIW